MRRLTGLLDRAVVRATVMRERGSRGSSAVAHLEQLATVERHVSAILKDRGADHIFDSPTKLIPEIRSRGYTRGRQVVDLTWRSTHRALSADVEATYTRFEHNQQAHVRWWRSPSPRSTLIGIHGYGQGTFEVDARALPVDRWLRAGHDVALFTLPFHGLRRAPGDKLRFPSGLPLVTIEGFRQAIGDLRVLMGWLLEAGAPRIGVVGMSLGGYTAGLLATIDERLSFGLLYIPLASIAEHAFCHRRFPGNLEQQTAQRDALERVYRVVSPLARQPRLSASRMLVGGAKYDGICPMSHAEQLAEHFGCDLQMFPGAHLLQTGRRQVWKTAEQRLASIRF